MADYSTVHLEKYAGRAVYGFIFHLTPILQLLAVVHGVIVANKINPLNTFMRSFKVSFGDHTYLKFIHMSIYGREIAIKRSLNTSIQRFIVSLFPS